MMRLPHSTIWCAFALRPLGFERSASPAPRWKKRPTWSRQEQQRAEPRDAPRPWTSYRPPSMANAPNLNSAEVRPKLDSKLPGEFPSCMANFMVYALDKPDREIARLAARDAHRARLREHDHPIPGNDRRAAPRRRRRDGWHDAGGGGGEHGLGQALR